jgi:hypothetical protein
MSSLTMSAAGWRWVTVSTEWPAYKGMASTWPVSPPPVARHPRGGPQLQFEALVQVAFADHGTPEQLIRTLDAVRRDAEANRARTEARGHEYLRDGGPFPDRLPIIALVAKLIIEQAALVARWAEWADELVNTWSSLDAAGGAEAPADAFRVTWNTPTPTP